MEHTKFVKQCLSMAGFSDKEIDTFHVEQKTNKEISKLIMSKAR